MAVSKKHQPEEILPGEVILQGMPGLVYVFDEEGKLLRWNKNIEKVLGYSSKELKGKKATEFLDKPFRRKGEELVSKTLQDGIPRYMEYKMLLKSGKKIPFLGSISLVLFQGKKHLVGQAIDISKQKDTEKDLKDKIKEINKLRRILEAENIYFRTERQNELSFEGIVGNSEALQHVLFRVEKVAPMDTTVLIEGETGTGKELITMAIHNLSHRKNKAFIKVNCANFSPTLIESELFGHERGAFTGAASRKIGWFELADGGTLFLDEIGELPMNLQTKLLQFLQTGEFHRLGGTKTIRVNVRLIAATNRKLDEMVKENLFRKDLFYRLNVYPITVAPLRDRKADIPLLTRHFVKQFNQKLGKKVTRIPASVMKKLENYAWPGNIRELQNVIERAVILSPDDTLVIENLFSSALEETEEWLSLREYERQYIVRVLEKTLWRVEGPKGAARILDMNPDTLRSRMRKLGIKKP